jgi:hypothetical protein
MRSKNSCCCCSLSAASACTQRLPHKAAAPIQWMPTYIYMLIGHTYVHTGQDR